VALERETLYLVAYCHLRQEERTFRFDRIVKLELCE
jgi:predicted DNA-binding transcriptional regulator YafY